MPYLRKFWWVFIISIILVAVLSVPPVWSRVVYHSHEAYRTVKYWLKPPNEAVFIPSSNEAGLAPTSISTASVDGLPTHQTTTEPTDIPYYSAPITATTPTRPDASPTPVVTELAFTPSPTLTSMPPSVLLRGISLAPQSMNNCGPATLAMYLSYYDVDKDQDTIAKVLKPNSKDVNVMPSELADFVNANTSLKALWRYGGDLQTIKALISAGFPVMIEKSFEPFDLRSEGWMGHYNLVVGFDDGKRSLTVQDSYLLSHTPWGLEIPKEMWDSFIGFDFSYNDLEQAWRSFNYVFIVVYPPEKENEVISLIGPLAEEEEACRIAYNRASQETSSLLDVRGKYFAWYNAGTSLVCLKNYGDAATAYDAAFGIYPNINVESRPYRMLWYQTGPYLAYYNSERHQDTINLANQTLDYLADPVLEESYYWRGLSYYALGDTTRAIKDLRNSLQYHPGFLPSISMLKELGMEP